MYFCTSYPLAVVFCVVTMLCWGSWGNTQKLAGKTWRYELFYWDYVLGVVLFALVSGLTAGSFGANPDWGFVANLRQASAGNLGSAFLGGIVFNAANILLAAAISIAGMSVAFPVGIGLALVLGVIVNYVGAPKGDAVTLFAGVGLIVVAILCNAFAYQIKQSNNSKQSNNLLKGILLSVICGVLMAFFYRFMACTMDMDFAKAAPAAGMMSPYSAFFVFALGILASNFVFNAFAMRHPVSGEPITERDYFKGGFPIHLVGIFGGLVWGLGNGISLVAAGKAGAAVSYGLGQGATLVSALWGILIWKEFAGAPKKSQVLNILMFVLFVAGLAFIIRAGSASAAGTRTLSLETFRDKMQGAWVGQMVGVAWGQPTEFKFNGKIIPSDKVPEWKDDFHDRYSYGNDDLYVEMTFLKTLEDYGLDVSPRQAGIDFANAEYGLWCANLQGRTNLRKGIAPPDSAHPRFSSRGNDIDYQIEADYSGIIAPGLPQEAIRLGNVFGRLVNWGDGLWAGEFVGALYCEAYFTRDVNALLDAGLRAIPAECDYAKMVRDLREWHRESPDCWSNAWAKVNENYAKSGMLRDSNGGIDARLNGACIVLGLLYGDGDFEKSMEISMRCGWDSDCNPSNVGGILGCAYGLKALPDKFKSTVNLHSKFSYTAYDLEGVYRISEKLARDVVVRYGGKIEDDAFVIPVRTPVPDAYLPTWQAGPVVGAKYTAEEMAKIRFAVKLPNATDLADPDPTRRVQKTLDALFPGWTALPCGRDRNPGYEEAVHLPKGQLDYGYVRTHPTKYCGTEPTGFTRDIARVPEGDPRLNVTVCAVSGRPVRIVLKVNGETVQEETVVWKGKDETGLRKLSFSLARFAGKSAKLELLHFPGGTTDESVCWGHLLLTANNGSF